MLGFYALSVMDSEGPLYGYMLAERIAERTDGAWRPGAGAIYPALNSLTRRKLAIVSSQGRRRVYRITPQGRSVLRRIRRTMAWRSRGGPDLSVLWAEVAGADDLGTFLLLRLRRSLDTIEGALAAPAGSGPSTRGTQSLRADVIAELTRRLESLRRREVRPVAMIPPPHPGGRL